MTSVCNQAAGPSNGRARKGTRTRGTTVLSGIRALAGSADAHRVQP
ncbi:MAG: hypothetical protein M0C28_34640 [Candidatus Moduliflexus flocculans]|nr:hypothetical protein [Candidatus Moduliflexus flocculans]